MSNYIVPSSSTAIRSSFDLKIALTLTGMCDPKFQSLTEFTTQHYHCWFGFRAEPSQLGWPGKVNLQFILIVEKICEHFCIVYMSLLDCLYVCLCAVLYIFEIVLRTSKQWVGLRYKVSCILCLFQGFLAVVCLSPDGYVDLRSSHNGHGTPQ